jgi:hypothetical protein
VRSHQRAVSAQRSGVLNDEIVPVVVKSKKGEETLRVDEHPRADTSVETLGKLRPMRLGVDPEATVTAGNSSGQNDAASVCIVTTRENADRYGLKPLARLKSWGLAGVAPNIMGIGPVPATAKALRSAGLALKEIDLIELNEAFASQVLACTREWKFAPSDFDRINVHGSGISLGHPVGATGGRILATLLREMDRRGARYGLETMCSARSATAPQRHASIRAAAERDLDETASWYRENANDPRIPLLFLLRGASDLRTHCRIAGRLRRNPPRRSAVPRSGIPSLFGLLSHHGRRRGHLRLCSTGGGGRSLWKRRR